MRVSGKTIGYLIAGIVLLSGLVWLQSRPRSSNTHLSSYLEQITVDKDSVERIALFDEEASIEMMKTSGVWMVGDIVADESKVEQLLDILLAPEPEALELVSETGLMHEDLGVVASGSAVVSIYSGDANLRFVVGSAFGSGSYFRLEDNTEVFLHDALDMNFTSLDVDDWFEEQILSIQEGNIQRLLIQSQESEYDFSKTDEGYMYDGQVIQRASIAPALNNLISLTAVAIPTGDEQALIEQASPSLVVKVDLSGDQQYVLNFYEGLNFEDTEFWAVEIENKAYLLSSEVVDSFDIQADDILLDTEGADE